MELADVRKAIEAAGGGNALAYAEPLLAKLNRLEKVGGYKALLAQLIAAKQQGDLRGRALEANFADAFESRGQHLSYGAKQTSRGDIDFSWEVAGQTVFVELKLRQQDIKTQEEIREQLGRSGVWSKLVTDDTPDICRLQRDILAKATTAKFDPTEKAGRVNLVGIDVSELQLGKVDLCDCLLAAAGNPAVARWCDESCVRPGVVGVFEDLAAPSEAEAEWIRTVHRLAVRPPHPRDYIHGALFLFRAPREPAALSYDLNGCVVWNSARISEALRGVIGPALHKCIPLQKF